MSMYPHTYHSHQFRSSAWTPRHCHNQQKKDSSNEELSLKNIVATPDDSDTDDSDDDESDSDDDESDSD